MTYDAAANSKGCYDLAIASLRARLEASKTIVDGGVIYNEDCRFILPTLRNVDSIITDPPYHLTANSRNGSPRTNNPATPHGRTGLQDRGFMGKQWDGGNIAFDPELWRLCLQALKPGGHLLAFGGTRTYHRMACAIEDAGFEIRDCIMWVYGSGFPKSHDVSKAIDKMVGAEREVVGEWHRSGSRSEEQEYRLTNDRGNITAPATEAAKQWEGWGTALKPAFEPIIVARKPLVGTVAANVLEHGTGALNVDGCRVGTVRNVPASHSKSASAIGATGISGNRLSDELDPNKGRWPANFIHDGSEEVTGLFPETKTAGKLTGNEPSVPAKGDCVYGFRDRVSAQHHDDAGSAARFFYCAKADKDDRLKSKHPTVKPIDLMAYLVRLVTPPGGTVLDPFAGSGATGMACMREGFRYILIEREREYFEDILARVSHVRGADTPLFAQDDAP